MNSVQLERLNASKDNARRMFACRESHKACMRATDNTIEDECGDCQNDCDGVSNWGFAATMVHQCECYELEFHCRNGGYTQSAHDACEDCMVACDAAEDSANSRGLSQNGVGEISEFCEDRCDAISSTWTPIG